MESKLNIQLLANTPDAERIVATAAKLCYSPANIEELKNSLTPVSIESFLDMLASVGHASPVEHINFTFAIEGVSRALTHQLVRHRIASYSQQSQRYVDGANFQYVLPPEIERIPEAKEAYVAHMKFSQATYNNLIELLMLEYASSLYPDMFPVDALEVLRQEAPKLYKAAEKKAFEDARYVLPNATETKIILTMNVRSLCNVFRTRCCERAQWEIREMADEMLKLCKHVTPTLFKNAGPSCTVGRCTEGKMSCGRQQQVQSKYALM